MLSYSLRLRSHRGHLLAGHEGERERMIGILIRVSPVGLISYQTPKAPLRGLRGTVQR